LFIINIMDSYGNLLLSDTEIERIKSQYNNKLKLVEGDIRHHWHYHETNPTAWIYKLVDNLIKENIGSEYSIYTRVSILKYTKGDYFLEHSDGSYNTSLDPNLSEHFYGGIEMSNFNDFMGGEFFKNGIVVPFKKGKINTHQFDEPHGVNEITSGVRWSLQFPIKWRYEINLI